MSKTLGMIAVPPRLITVRSGKLHPSTRVSVSASFTKTTILPVLHLDLPRDDDSFEITLSAIPIPKGPCSFDFFQDILPTLQLDVEETLREDYDGIFAAQVIVKQISNLEFVMGWNKGSDVGTCAAAGYCLLELVHSPNRLKGYSGSIDAEKTAWLSMFFAELPDGFPDVGDA